MARGSGGGIGDDGGKKPELRRSKRKRGGDEPKQEEAPKNKKTTRARTSKEKVSSHSIRLTRSKSARKLTEQPSSEEEPEHHELGLPPFPRLSRPKPAPEVSKPVPARTRLNTTRSLRVVPVTSNPLLEFLKDDSPRHKLPAGTYPSLPNIEKQSSLAHDDAQHPVNPPLPLNPDNERASSLHQETSKADDPSGPPESKVPDGDETGSVSQIGSPRDFQARDAFNNLEAPQPIRTSRINYVLLSDLADGSEPNPALPPISHPSTSPKADEGGWPGGIDRKEVGRLFDEMEAGREPASRPYASRPAPPNVEADPLEDF